MLPEGVGDHRHIADAHAVFVFLTAQSCQSVSALDSNHTCLQKQISQLYNKKHLLKKSTCWQGNIPEVSQSEKGLQSYLCGLVLTLLSEYTFIHVYIN